MGRKDPPDRPDPPSDGRLNQLHGEMRDRGLVHEQEADRRRKRRNQRRRTTEVTIKESTETISRQHNDEDSRSRRRKEREKKKSHKSSQSVSFAKEISTTDAAERDDRSKPLKSSLKNSTLKIAESERGETSSSGVQSGSNNSDADSLNQKTQKRQRSATRSTLDKTKKSDGQPQRKTSSDSEGDQNFSDMLRIKAQQRKQRAAEQKVEESERKLIEFAQRLSARKTKLEELHVRLKQRKEKLKEREDKLKYFEAQITDREAKLKAKSKVVRHHEAHLRHEEGSVELREKSVTDKLVQLEARTKLVEVKEDLSVEINDLARKQLYQSSWSMNHSTKANPKLTKYLSKSTESLDNLSDIDSDNLVNGLANCTLSRPETVYRVQKEVGLLL